MSLFSIAGAGAAKTLIAVTVSLHPGAAHHSSHQTTVRAGDTLSSISQRELGKASDWPALWWANRHTVHNPSLILAGQRLAVPSSAKVKPWLEREALTAIPVAVSDPAPAKAAAAPVASAPAASPAPASAPVTTSAPASYSGAPGSFQSCVIQAESGGNASAVNPSSGAGGLYGFLPSTWQSLGFSGLPENASVAQQNAAFAKEYAQSGASAWAAYDGC
ncbi:MAG TPA: transglycosylase family protein [Streptosporangiaceae bacterium]|nr:transglycosylase family protein [Streptosporangiaceae bacterium]